MISITIITAAFFGTLLALLVLLPLAPRWRLMDHPGGRKDHLGTTPVVGGISIALVFIAALFYVQPNAWWVAAMSVSTLLILGVIDDIRDLKPSSKLLAQAGVVLLMYYLADMRLTTVGNLVGFGPIGTWFLAPVITVFAVIGVINAINMADGIDGHAGFISLIAFSAYAYVARESALWDQYKLLLVLVGSVSAFLVLNARAPWLKHAKTFLGDAGSMVLGFIIAWFAVDLTHGTGRTFSPIGALWVVGIPLCDCVSLMIRRRLGGGHIFAADRQHLHHYLLARGLSVAQATMATAAASLVCATIALVGWKMHVSESAMFAGFITFFIAYHLHISRAFRDASGRKPAAESVPAEMPLG